MAIRAINTAGSAPTDIVVNGVNIGNATAGYTTLAAAFAAGSADDIFVGTDAIDMTLTGADYPVAYAFRLTCADSVRPARNGAYGSGARVDHNASLEPNHSSGTTIIENIGRNSGTGTAIDTTGTGAVRISRLRGLVDTIYAFILGRNASSIITDNNCVELGDGTATNACFIWNFSSGDEAVKCFNDTVIITNDTTSHTHVFRGQSGSQRINVTNCASLEASGATAPTTAHFANCIAHTDYSAGNNMASDTSAPGTTTHDNVAAEDYTLTTDNDPANIDFHVIDRATAESYPGSDVSTEVYVADLDCDNGERGDEWYVGADHVAAAAAASADDHCADGYHGAFEDFGVFHG